MARLIICWTNSFPYIASDSRITWGNNDIFDYCKKVFTCKQFPEIFGYCGDVLFPSIVLSQIAEMISCIEHHIQYPFTENNIGKNRPYAKASGSAGLGIQIIHQSRRSKRVRLSALAFYKHVCCFLLQREIWLVMSFYIAYSNIYTF